MNQLFLLAAVAMGGAVGSLLRLAAQNWIGLSPRGFPTGIFTANMLGCLLLGFSMVYLTPRVGPAARAGIQVGLLGALTTFSTYCFQSIDLTRHGQFLLAAVYTVGSVVLGLLAVWLGLRLGAWLTPAPR